MIVVIGCPLIGYLSDKWGKRGFVLLGSGLLLTVSHIYFSLMTSCPMGEGACYSTLTIVTPLLIFYIGYSAILANMTPVLKMIMPHSRLLGIAIGISTSL